MPITNKTYIGGQGGYFGNLNVSPTPSFTPTVTPTSSVTPSVSPTNTPTISNTPSNSPTVSNSRTNTPTISNTKTNTPTPSKTIPVTPTNTPSGTNLKLPATPPPAQNRTQIPVIFKDGPIDAPNIAITRSQTPTPTGTTTPTPSNTPASTLTATPTQTPTTTGTGTPTNTPTKTNTPTNTASSTTTRTASPTQTPTQSVTPTLSNTPTPTITLTNSPTKSSKPTATPSRTPSNTKSEGATATPSTTPTFTPTNTSTGTPTFTPTTSPTSTFTPTPTRSPRTSPTPTATPTLTQTYSPTPTLSPSPSYSPTPTSIEGPFRDVIAVYQFNNNLYDSSCNGYNLTTNPNYQYNYVSYNGTGKYGPSVKFDGTASYEATYPSTFPNCPKITVLAWVKVGSGYVSTLDSNPVYKSTINGKSIYDFGVDKNGYVYAKIFDSVFTSSKKINNNTWYLVLWQIDTATTPRSVKLNMTVDGVGSIYLVGNIAPNNVPNGNNSTIIIGGGKFNGEIDNLIIWSRVLSDTEIATINRQPYLVELCPSQTPTPTITPTSTITLTPTRTPTNSPQDGTNPYFSISEITGASSEFAAYETDGVGGTFKLIVDSYGSRGTKLGSYVYLYVVDDIDFLTYYIQNNTVPDNFLRSASSYMYQGLISGSSTIPNGMLVKKGGEVYRVDIPVGGREKNINNNILNLKTYYVAIVNNFEQWSNIQRVAIPYRPKPTPTATPTKTPGPTTTRTPTPSPTKPPPPPPPALNYYTVFNKCGGGKGFICNPGSAPQIMTINNFDGTYDVALYFYGTITYVNGSGAASIGGNPSNPGKVIKYPTCGWHDLGIRLNKGADFWIYDDRTSCSELVTRSYHFTI